MLFSKIIIFNFFIVFPVSIVNETQHSVKVVPGPRDPGPWDSGTWAQVPLKV